jgi:hypothetical protein
MQYSQRPFEWHTYFHLNIPDLILGQDLNSSSIQFELSVNGQLVLEETYFWDVNGIIRVRNIGEIIDKYFDTSTDVVIDGEVTTSTNTSKSIYFKITDSGSIYEGHFVALKCDADINYNADSFAVSNFLTRANFAKKTTLFRNEYLSFLKKKSDGVKYLRVKLVSGESNTSNITEHLETIQTFGSAALPGSHDYEVYTFNVSMMLILSKLSLPMTTQVLSYEVWVSDTSGGDPYTPGRPYLFLSDATNYIYTQDYFFINCFGVPETFTATGLKTTKTTAEYALANISDHYRKTSQNFIIETTQNTGFLSDEEMVWTDDLLNSYQVSTYDKKKSTGMDITLVALDKTATNNNELQSFSFTYRKSKNRHSEFSSMRNKIFDYTFNPFN